MGPIQLLNRNFIGVIRADIRRNKSLNSTEWLERQLKDPYVEKAKMENYRCRSAYKLIEIDDRYKIIKPGQNVIDIGAAPGSWTQVLVRRTNSDGKGTATCHRPGSFLFHGEVTTLAIKKENISGLADHDGKKPKGKVISVDLIPIYPLEGAVILSKMDFTKGDTRDKINDALDGKKLDFVLSDMAPNSSGVKSLDSDAIFKLAASVLVFAVGNLNPGGGCLIKMWEGKHGDIAKQMKRFFNCFNYCKPNSSRKESAEIFLLARDFVSPKLPS